MAKIGNTIATLLVGVAVGVAAGYVLATDKGDPPGRHGKAEERAYQPEGKIRAKEGARPRRRDIPFLNCKQNRWVYSAS